MLVLWKKSCDQPRQHIEKQKHYFALGDTEGQGILVYAVHEAANSQIQLRDGTTTIFALNVIYWIPL